MNDPAENELGQPSAAAAGPFQPSHPSNPLGPKMLRFCDLARCGDEIWIEHKGQIYRLRKTRQDKLILTK